MGVIWNTDGSIKYTQYMVSNTVMQSFLNDASQFSMNVRAVSHLNWKIRDNSADV